MITSHSHLPAFQGRSHRASSSSVCKCAGSKQRHDRGYGEVWSRVDEPRVQHMDGKLKPHEGMGSLLGKLFKRFLQWTKKEEEDILDA